MEIAAGSFLLVAIAFGALCIMPDALMHAESWARSRRLGIWYQQRMFDEHMLRLRAEEGEERCSRRAAAPAQDPLSDDVPPEGVLDAAGI